MTFRLYKSKEILYYHTFYCKISDKCDSCKTKFLCFTRNEFSLYDDDLWHELASLTKQYSYWYGKKLARKRFFGWLSKQSNFE